MTIALDKFANKESDLFDIMNDLLWGDPFLFIGWSGLLHILPHFLSF